LSEILRSIQETLQSLSFGQQVLLVFAISMVPVIELRGALPMAAAIGMDWKVALPVILFGNLLPAPFILLFIRKIFEWLKTRTRLGGFVERLEKKGERNKDRILKYEFWGLCVFVAIPLPGTGAWTGALIAALLGMRVKKALPSLAIGVLSAGIILTILSYSPRWIAALSGG